MDVDTSIPRYSLDEDNELVLRPATWWEPSWKSRIALRSALFRYFLVQKKVFLRHQDVRSIGGLPLRESNASSDSEGFGSAGMSASQRQEKTWHLIEAMFQEMRDTCARRGAVFAIAFRGWHDEIDEPIGAQLLPPPPREKDPFCLNERLSEMGRDMVGPIAARLGIPYLDLTEALHAAVARTKKSHRFPDDNHLSALGHRGAGEAMSDWVEKELLAQDGFKPVRNEDR